MEILSNLSWAVVVVALVGGWLAQPRRQDRHSVLPGLGMQLMALLILAAVLLPVISLTDDLQATVIVAECEHFSRRCDLQSSQDQTPPHTRPVPLGPLTATLDVPRLGATAFVTAAEPALSLTAIHFRSPWSRPPPVV